jgi:hypothetical protein
MVNIFLSMVCFLGGGEGGWPWAIMGGAMIVAGGVIWAASYVAHAVLRLRDAMIGQEIRDQANAPRQSTDWEQDDRVMVTAPGETSGITSVSPNALLRSEK